MEDLKLMEIVQAAIGSTKEKSSHAWAIWCDRNQDFHRLDGAPLIFQEQFSVDLCLGTDRCPDCKVVQVKIIVL